MAQDKNARNPKQAGAKTPGTGQNDPPPPTNTAWQGRADDIQRWVDQLPLPAFTLATDTQSIHGNQALEDWLVGIDPANLYADAHCAKDLKTVFPRLVEAARNCLGSATPHTETFQWSIEDRPFSGRLQLFPLDGVVADRVLGWIEESEAEQRLVEGLKARMGLVRMLSEISARAIRVEDLHDFLDECLWLIGRATGVGGVFLWEYNARENTFSNTCEWLQSGIPSHKAQLQDIPADALPTVVAALRDHRILNIPDTRDITAPLSREFIDLLGIAAILIIPLYQKNRLYGFMGVEEYARPRVWEEGDVGILKAAGEILVRAIENKQIETELDDYRANLQAMVQERTEELEQTNAALNREVAKRKKIAAELMASEAELARKSKRLAEVNAALRELLQQVRADRRQFEETAYRKYRELVEPKLHNLKDSGLSSKQATLLGLIEKNIREIYVVDRCSLMPEFKTLTAKEIQGGDFIRYGKTSREIAELMNISVRTVEVYRFNIRKKLGLNKRKADLRTYLLSLEPC